MHALGLTLTGAAEDLGLLPGPGTAGRECALRVRAAEAIDEAWTGRGTRIHEQRHPEDGSVLFAVERDPALGFRLAAPGYGVQAVSADGHEITLAPPPEAAPEPWRSRLLLYGRALPVAAVLQGIEVLHASAVITGGRLIGLVAASGVGKSSLAAHLVAQGGAFFTDDVLAVERDGDGVLAHPGPRFTKVARHELAAAADPGRLGRELGEHDGEVLLEPGPAAAPAPLHALYVLRRTGPEPFAVRALRPDPRLLLAMSYVFDVETPERLDTQLAVSAALAATVPIFEANLPETGAAADAAARLAAHAAEEPA